ncbi:MAG: gamma-glutamyl-gamma-aminobutyrate hydrolase family protein [Armatimonadota bacterium]|nr:gamma-glutamyl-gamma-aminobutyrate hydrolase family protein [Armatimonadota bacterium]MDR7533579.1 gamma-glutamyl-gamma-aminobutyrate hydrolase family protein [Armatimonadota bacterium]MDR7537379.1 gamma-glutamyl-gamma-aminobutyrate hydrolase family protein [Armatimonadota bacterium]
MRAAACYADAVREAGGDPILVAPGDPLPTAVDGVLLSGGVDVHPRHYGQAVDPGAASTLAVDEPRDLMELDLVRHVLDRDTPLLGICRGAQVLNVAAGGTLWQDLSLAGVDPRRHDQDGWRPDWDAAHGVTVERSSRLGDAVGVGALGVNSFHHQAVAAPAPGFCIVARADDGTVEGVESTRHRFVVGVQWHPERMAARHAVQRRLFAALVAATRRA